MDGMGWFERIFTDSFIVLAGMNMVGRGDL